MVALVSVGCSGSASNTQTTTQASVPQGHPQVIEPVAGAAPSSVTTPALTVPTGGGPTPAPSAVGPASVTKAPSKGAPTDAEIRAAIARFQIAIAQYHLNLLNFNNVVFDPTRLPPGVWNVSIASVEIAYGHAVACGGVMYPSELGTAHKTLPCGTMVTFKYGNRAIRVPVIDRGPYIPGREWDISGAAAVALHFPGLGPIEWRLN